MKTTVNCYGFEVEADYRIENDEVIVDKTSVKAASNISALDGMDIISTVKEIIEAELRDHEKIGAKFNEETPF